jgi:hypothetical protein
VTVDIALATGSTLAGVGVTQLALLAGFSPPVALTIGTVAFLAALWIAPMYLKEPLVEAVDRIYQELISTKPSLLRY